MSVGTETAHQLISSLSGFNQTLRCVISAQGVPRDQGVAVQGVLRVLAESEPARASEVAARLGVGPSALSRHLADLEANGYLDRHPDPEDGRAHLLSLSESGRELLRQATERKSELIRQALQSWDEQEALDAVVLLDKLSITLETFLRPKTSRNSASTHWTENTVGA